RDRRSRHPGKHFRRPERGPHPGLPRQGAVARPTWAHRLRISAYDGSAKEGAMTDPQAIDARNSTDPIRPVSGACLLGFAAAWFGFWLLVMLPGQFMVVKLASVLSPEHKVGVSSDRKSVV